MFLLECTLRNIYVTYRFQDTLDLLTMESAVHQLCAQLPNAGTAGEPFLTWPTCWWGAHSFRKLFSIIGLLTGFAALCRWEWNPRIPQFKNKDESQQKHSKKTKKARENGSPHSPQQPGLKVNFVSIALGKAEKHSPIMRKSSLSYTFSTSSCFCVICRLYPPLPLLVSAGVSWRFSFTWCVSFFSALFSLAFMLLLFSLLSFVSQLFLSSFLYRKASLTQCFK